MIINNFIGLLNLDGGVESTDNEDAVMTGLQQWLINSLHTYHRTDPDRRPLVGRWGRSLGCPRGQLGVNLFIVDIVTQVGVQTHGDVNQVCVAACRPVQQQRGQCRDPTIKMSTES